MAGPFPSPDTGCSYVHALLIAAADSATAAASNLSVGRCIKTRRGCKFAERKFPRTRAADVDAGKGQARPNHSACARTKSSLTCVTLYLCQDEVTESTTQGLQLVLFLLAGMKICSGVPSSPPSMLATAKPNSALEVI